ncbi:C40 family peptidase [Cohnella luojiensis]|uniref:Peptidoglycan endopeptidase n=1 Tax=Cohnella luojiensis TaxID=652876 RepID=A0A4Y8LPP4_9BACL|nr:C40 family peptidase [Cohnella luojiensis]TFE19513.1 peptidoglycan endopeptidase [Cohnella luojiensis]
MKKHVMGLFAAVLLIGGFGSVPAVSAASSAAPTMKKLSTVKSNNETTTSNDESTASNEEINNDSTDGGNPADDGSTDGQATESIEKVISAGLKYTGTPYEFGSNRSTTKTFDCSDFVRWIFKETLEIALPADSRQQGSYVKENGTAETDWHNLQRGDLMFFMSYKGSKEESYKSIDKSEQRITHVAIYMGEGKIMHTYSNASGGVHVGDFADTAWEHRFLFGGSVLPQ